jgi:uncharacterized protein (UPF0332 family)
MKTIDDCFRRGLRRTSPDIDSAKRSILTAQKHLKDADTIFRAKVYSSAIICSYEAMFHAARAVLFKDGVKEHSHVCIPVYIKDAYPELESYANVLDTYRIYREKVAYGLDVEVMENEARYAMENAREFVEIMGSIIK